MKAGLLILALAISVWGCKTGTPKTAQTSKEVEVVDPDYGILTAREKTRAGLRPLMWKCFPIKDVQVEYRTWPFTDPTEPKRFIEVMCDFEIWVKSKPNRHVYHGRRGKPESYCTDFKAAWKRLTHGEEHICLDGETLTKGAPSKDQDTKETKATWTWDKIKTKKGCYSFWEGNQCTDF